MPTNFNTIQTEVLARLGNRTDLTARVPIWINDAIAEIAQSPRFNFSEIDISGTIPTVIGTQTYDLTTLTSFWFILDIRDLTNTRRIKQISYKEIDGMVPSTGQPTRYARYASSFILDPTPDAVYSIVVRYRQRPSQVSENIAMPFQREWDEPITLMAVVKGLEALDQRDKAIVQRQLLEPLLSIREDVSLLEDRDWDYGLKPVIDGRMY